MHQNRLDLIIGGVTDGDHRGAPLLRRTDQEAVAGESSSLFHRPTALPETRRLDALDDCRQTTPSRLAQHKLSLAPASGAQPVVEVRNEQRVLQPVEAIE